MSTLIKRILPLVLVLLQGCAASNAESCKADDAEHIAEGCANDNGAANDNGGGNRCNHPRTTKETVKHEGVCIQGRYYDVTVVFVRCAKCNAPLDRVSSWSSPYGSC